METAWLPSDLLIVVVVARELQMGNFNGFQTFQTIKFETYLLCYRHMIAVNRGNGYSSMKL